MKFAIEMSRALQDQGHEMAVVDPVQHAECVRLISRAMEGQDGKHAPSQPQIDEVR